MDFAECGIHRAKADLMLGCRLCQHSLRRALFSAGVVARAAKLILVWVARSTH